MIRRGPVSSSYLVEIMMTMIVMKLKMVTNLIIESSIMKSKKGTFI